MNSEIRFNRKKSQIFILLTLAIYLIQINCKNVRNLDSTIQCLCAQDPPNLDCSQIANIDPSSLTPQQCTSTEFILLVKPKEECIRHCQQFACIAEFCTPFGQLRGSFNKICSSSNTNDGIAENPKEVLLNHQTCQLRSQIQFDSSCQAACMDLENSEYDQIILVISASILALLILTSILMIIGCVRHYSKKDMKSEWFWLLNLF